MPLRPISVLAGQGVAVVRDVKGPTQGARAYPRLVSFQGHPIIAQAPTLTGNQLEAGWDEFFPLGLAAPVARLSTTNADGSSVVQGAPDPYLEQPDRKGRRVVVEFQPGEALEVLGVAELKQADSAFVHATPAGMEAEFFADEPSFMQALASYVNLSRLLAAHPEIPEWAAEHLLRTADLQTLLAIVQNPALPERLYPQAAALFEAWITNPALPLYVLVNPEPPSFLPRDSRDDWVRWAKSVVGPADGFVENPARPRRRMKAPPTPPVRYVDLVREPEQAPEYATSTAEDIFDESGIHHDPIEAVRLVAVDGDQVVGALTLGGEEDDMGHRMTFSIAVEPAYRRHGLAREFIRRALAIVAEENPGSYFRLWVVNPHMVPLLEEFGFETEGRGWSEDTPHMYKY
ncbi:MAG: GNAT family N-acetyltransferase [Rhodanobacteraceae bacterium]|nr:GNAT family N-acetyltransferase [Rhodanobacteraceae bacterium]